MNRTRLLASAGVIGGALCAAPAFAAGTASGTTITNTATITYSVGGVAQNAINAANSFRVDRRVVLTAVEATPTGASSVSPGQNGAVTTFTVTNLSNAPLDIGLSIAQPTTGTTTHGQNDTFDVTAGAIWVDTNGVAGLQTSGGTPDTQIAYVDELAADASRTVYYVGNVPIGEGNGEAAGVTLTAQAREPGGAGTQGAVVTNTTGANNVDPLAVDTVLADTAYDANNVANDGLAIARDSYLVAAPVVTVVKTSRVISDPINSEASGNAKMIPGAVVEYCIAVTNGAGGAVLTAPVVSDPIPTATTYVANSLFTDQTVSGGVCTGSTAGTGYVAGPPAVITETLPNIGQNTTRGVRFRVTIN
jgi:uncharacterized repeat protein (TIGR01451 family)